jgi:hypothetical protein
MAADDARYDRRLCSPMSMHAAGNPRSTSWAPVHHFPDPQGGLTAGLHASVFSMQSRPMAPEPERRRPRTVKTGPTPQDVLTRGK